MLSTCFAVLVAAADASHMHMMDAMHTTTDGHRRVRSLHQALQEIKNTSHTQAVCMQGIIHNKTVSAAHHDAQAALKL